MNNSNNKHMKKTTKRKREIKLLKKNSSGLTDLEKVSNLPISSYKINKIIRSSRESGFSHQHFFT